MERKHNKVNGGDCPNCGYSKLQKKFRVNEANTEVYCLKCGFVLFG